MTGTTLSDAIEEYLVSIEAGNYRSNAGSALKQWANWLARERNVSDIGSVDVIDCRRYARHLKREVRANELKSSTAHTYYAYIRAFLGFCEADELISRNPAAVSRAQAELPEDTADANRQFWSTRDRNAILAFMDRRVEQALDGEADVSRERAYRDRALVRLLALSGVRGAEVFRDSADEKRAGIAWKDVDIEGGAVRVFGKSREYEYAQLPQKAADALERYHRVLDPPTPGFPVFPTDHAPSKYRAARDALREEFSPEEVERILDGDIDDVVREHEIVLPAISTRGARNLMKRLCESAGLDIDGEYLKPHGARRGLGHQLYSEGHAELAQSALRHASIATTHESYSNIRASETANRVDDVLDED